MPEMSRCPTGSRAAHLEVLVADPAPVTEYDLSMYLRPSPAGAGHDPGYPAQPGIQVGFVRFPLGRGQFRVRWRFATGLCVVVGHGDRQIYPRI
jgi:hypothetical protein